MMVFVSTLLALVGLLTLSLLRYLYLGRELKKFLEYFCKKDDEADYGVEVSSPVESSNPDQEIFVSGHYKLNKRSGLIVIVADTTGLIFRRFLFFNLLIEWCNIKCISIFEYRAKIYFKKEGSGSNTKLDYISVPWNHHMTEVARGKVALFGE